jgi:hypothetical protein
MVSLKTLLGSTSSTGFWQGLISWNDIWNWLTTVRIPAVWAGEKRQPDRAQHDKVEETKLEFLSIANIDLLLLIFIYAFYLDRIFYH